MWDIFEKSIICTNAQFVLRSLHMTNTILSLLDLFILLPEQQLGVRLEHDSREDGERELAVVNEPANPSSIPGVQTGPSDEIRNLNMSGRMRNEPDGSKTGW